MSRLQTKRAIYLTKTPFVLLCLCKWNLTLTIVQGWKCFHAKNHLDNLAFLCFALKKKFYLDYFANTFSIWRLKNIPFLGKGWSFKIQKYGHLTPLPAWEGGHLITTHRGVGNLIASLHFMLPVALIPHGSIHHGVDSGDKL